LIAGVLILLTMRLDLHATFREFCTIWYLWVPGFAAFTLYSLMWVEARYLAQFYVLLWAACLTLVRLPNSVDSRRLLKAVLLVVAVLMGIRVAINCVSHALHGHRNANAQMKIAEGLSAEGVQPGEKIAFVGSTSPAWQKLAGVQIVAEADEENFCVSDIAKWREIDAVLSRTGAQVFVAESLNLTCTEGWQRVGETSIYIHQFPALGFSGN
jgi:hypothetical protein